MQVIQQVQEEREGRRQQEDVRGGEFSSRNLSFEEEIAAWKWGGKKKVTGGFRLLNLSCAGLRTEGRYTQ